MKTNRQNGFTLIELMLSMSFIAVMLIAIALCVMQMGSIYNRGETLRHINQSVRSLVSDFQQTLGSADASSINSSLTGSNGRLCTGQYTYVWNSRQADGSMKFVSNAYSLPVNSEDTIRLIRIADPGGRYCRDEYRNRPIERTSAAQPIGLLADGDRPLIVHSLSVSDGVNGSMTGQKLFSVRMMLGTDNLEEISGGQCRPPSDAESNFDYCAVNEFSFTVRAGVR